MPRSKTNPSSDIIQLLLETYAANGAMNQLLLAHLEPRAWRATPERKTSRGSRTLAEIFAQLHNNHLRWLELSAPHIKRPAKLDPEHCTIKQACAAHRWERGAVFGNAYASSQERRQKTRHRIFAWQLGTHDLARRCRHVCLHVRPRRSPPGPNHHAGASDRLPTP
jgi:hypothetical protein